MKSRLLVAVCGLSFLSGHALTGASGISATLIPDQIHPGDVFRLEVTRSSPEYAEFELDIPYIGHLHLLGTEASPITLKEGRYIQKESWIFQADMSGEILLEEIKVRIISGMDEESITLPPMRLLVTSYPYPTSDQDASPMELEFPGDKESSGFFGVYLFIIFVLAAAGIFLVARRKRVQSGSQSKDVRLLDKAIADLEKGLLNPDSLCLFYENNSETFSTQLRFEIEQAIFAHRGDPERLANMLRREVSQ